MNKRVYNFYAGPATLPLPVLEEAQRDLLNFNSSGMSVMEISHRSKEYESFQNQAEARMKRLLNLDDKFKVLFLQGGASTQFAMVPMNFLSKDSTADYILTGGWSEKAQKEALRYGNVHIAASTENENYNRIPDKAEIKPSEKPVYVHITSNNTLFGTEWFSFPDFGDTPLIADMSSDLLSHQFDASKFSLIYAGAQKNLGPAGVTIVIIRQDLMEKVNKDLPTMLRYETHVKNNSLYNTPSTFGIYMVALVLKWLEDMDGISVMEKKNQEKAGLIYQEIDNSNGFYRGHAQKDSRSLMNITFRLSNEELEKKFVQESTSEGLIGLKGHRSVGGLRASTYNAMTYEGCKALADFMKHFREKNS